ncbi:MAG: hypothetical protein M1821_005842 [Bathelium mastoideum]|nr:MAG: hypothetical protein M1821_005842 [Bathelium mastoideum]
MEKKNIAFTKDGMKVGVKEIRNEEYADKTQGVLVKAWNSASIPAYKSRLGWNNSSTTTSSSPSTRPEVRRSKSSQPSVPRPSAGSRTSSSGSHKGAGSNGLAHSHSSGGLHAPRPAPVRQSSNPGAWPS